MFNELGTLLLVSNMDPDIELFVILSLLTKQILGGDRGGPARRLVPALHGGRVGDRAHRRTPPRSLRTRALRAVYFGSSGGQN